MNSKVLTNFPTEFLTYGVISFTDLDTGTPSKTYTSQGFQ